MKLRDKQGQIRIKKASRLRAFIRARKAQIRMTETIAVIFIFFLLIVFGIIFYVNYSKVAAKEKQQELLGTRAMEITLQTLFLPELICSRGEAEPEDNCFDLLKLRQVNETFAKHFGEYYFDLFPHTTIKIEEIYPGDEKWVIYDKPLPDWINKEATYFIVALKDETRGIEEGVYSYGVLTVEVYS